MCKRGVSLGEAGREEMNNDLSEGSLPEPSFVRRGLYAEQIERYFNYFDRDQIMIVDSRRLRWETPRTMAEIAAFVGLGRTWNSWSLRSSILQ